jgi:hypothetical protein
LNKETIIARLESIYSQLPKDTFCHHCHECCGPIIWFKPEEILIRTYCTQHNIQYVVWSKEEFKNHAMRCPYLYNNRCKIYPVRPIVCRLQGHLPELFCPYKTKDFITPNLLKRIKKQFDTLVREVDGIGVYYSTYQY